ncbi:MAG TPA: asparagine synthase-related protein [Methylomirabilota bacterium]|nr:asparagine synthase-related protein [Methylomirabilota bacterium]
MSSLEKLVKRAEASVIGGQAYAAPDVGSLETLRRMAAAVTPATATVAGGQGPGSLFAAGAAIEQTDNVWVVADMDLLNREELTVLAGGHPEQSSLLSRLYAQEGPSFVTRLQGAFAIALWDRAEQSLLLAVDHFGLRRMHYATVGARVVFASRLAAVVAAAGVGHSLDLASIYDYLNYRFVPSPETPYSGVRRLPPGHLLRARRGHVVVRAFWDMRYPEERHREDRAAGAAYRLTYNGVRDSLRGLTTTGTGAFLSGGTDSSAVVGLMARITGERVNAFSIGFHEDSYDELRFADITARHFNAHHYTRIVTADAALDALPGLVGGYDEPLGNNSVIGTLFCAELAREHGLTHLLAGDGGDEIFGGNERYRTDRVFGLYSSIPPLLRHRVLEPVLFGLPDGMPGVLGRAQKYVRRAKIPNPARFFSYEFFVAQHAAQLLHPDFVHAVRADGPWRLLDEHYARVETTSELNRLLYLDLKLAVGDNDLLKVVRTAELAGINVRFPLLSVPLVEFTGTLPAHFKVRGLEKRFLFKRAFRGLLAPETLAKRKQGFGVPTATWFKTHPGFRALVHDTLLSARTVQRGYFQPEALKGLLELHDSEKSAYYGDILWAVLMLELWQRRHVDNAQGTR